MRIRAARGQAGLSLVEILVSIGVIGVLLSIAAPALRGARRAAGEVASLSNLRQIGPVVESYAQTNNLEYPMMRPGVRYQNNLDGLSSWFMVMGEPSWSSAHLWALVVRQVAPWHEHAHAWISPGTSFEDATTHNTVRPSYWYSNSFVAAPRLWTPEGAADAPSRPSAYYGPVRTHTVRYPGSKAMFYDFDMAYDRRFRRISNLGSLPDSPMPVLFADGHAATHHPRDATPPFPNPLNTEWWGTSPLQNTPEGVLGRDY